MNCTASAFPASLPKRREDLSAFGGSRLPGLDRSGNPAQRGCRELQFLRSLKVMIGICYLDNLSIAVKQLM